MVPQIIFANDGAKCIIHVYSGNLNLTYKSICPIHNIEQVKEEDVVDQKDDKPIIPEKVVDDEWCLMCNGRNLHRIR
jgi:hypothetical protein